MILLSQILFHMILSTIDTYFGTNFIIPAFFEGDDSRSTSGHGVLFFMVVVGGECVYVRGFVL